MSDFVICKQKVRNFMKKKNIKTQTELAQLMGITKNQLSVILSPKFDPIKSNVRVLCDILNVSLSDIINSEGNPPKKETPNLQTQLTIGNILSLQDEEEDDENTSIKIDNSSTSRFIDISKIIPKRQYNVVELFAGAGGLALGLEEAGFYTAGLVEIDKYACNTLRKNRPQWNVIEEDVIKVAEKGIHHYLKEDIEIDLLSGGYPCQAFSYAGQKKGLEDVRGTMFYYYASILEQLKPKMFLAENVRGLLSHEKGKTLETMINVFENIGYNVSYHLLKANDYNVAQKRERVVIIGIRKDLDIEYKLPKPFEYKPVLRDALKDVPSSEGTKYPPKKHKVLELVPAGGCWVDLPEDIAKDYMGASYYSGGGKRGMARRISWDEPCLTLTCSPAQKQTERCHPEEIRPFTVREYARIQSFPDEWAFHGSVTQQYKQIGNAVPVEFAKAVGLSIIDILNKL